MTQVFNRFTMEVLPLGPLETNCYILTETVSGQCVVVDPAEEAEFLISHMAAQSIQCRQIVLTHGHYDHIGALSALAEATGAEVAIHKLDHPMLLEPASNFSSLMGENYRYDKPVKLLSDGDTIAVGKAELRVLHTPGHTLGGICLLAEDFLLSGDTLFQLSVGRSDFPGGDASALIRSIREKLMVLPDSLPVFPGHGPATTIANEKRGNPYL